MPRQLPQEIYNEIQKTITSPVYLVSISDDTNPMYYSSGPAIAYDGDTYIAHDVQVINIRPDKNTATVKIGNTDLGIGAIILGAGIAGREIKIYQHYNGSTVLLVNGIGSDATVSGRWGEIKVVDNSVSFSRAPRVRFSDENFSHLPTAGTVIRWGNEEFTIERDNG